MKHIVALIIKRLLVLLCGFLLAWFTAFQFFPFIDGRVPLALAVFVTYCFLAYAGLPAFVRVWQLVHKPTHVPTRSIERDGWAADAINIVILAKNEKDFIWAMRKAGWLQADPPSLHNTVKTIVAIALNRAYPTAPFDSNYVFGRKQDLGFQIATNKSPLRRHHVRFWRLGTTLLEDEHEHHNFWRKLLRRFATKEKQMWIGASSFDWGINARIRNLQLGHGVDGNTIAERDFLVETLRKARVLHDAVAIKAGEPLRTRSQRFGETIVADGYVKLCEIKRQLLPPRDEPHA